MKASTNNDLQFTVALAALGNVIDPEIGLNVVDLGLIYRIDFSVPGPEIAVLMTLTTPFCPMGDAITSAVEQVLHDTFAASKVTVNLTFDPPWSHDRISPAGKEFLNG